MFRTNIFRLICTSMIISVFCSCFSVQVNETININKKIPDSVKLHLDNVAFEENELMTIYTGDNEIGYYDRFVNKSFNVNSAKIYSQQKQLIYSIVPEKSIKGITLHVRDNNNKRGKISLSSKMSGFMGIELTSNVDFFSKGYDLKISMSASFSGVVFQYLILLNKKYVMAFNYEGQMDGNNKSEIIVDKNYLDAYPDDVSFWAVATLILNEINEKEANNSSNRSAASGTNFNTDGTVDRNFNPHDKF